MNNVYLFASGQHVNHTSGMSSIIWCWAPSSEEHGNALCRIWNAASPLLWGLLAFIAQKNRWILGCFDMFGLFIRFYYLLFVWNDELRLGDCFQSICWHFRKIQNFYQIWDLGPLILCRNTQTYKKHTKSCLENLSCIHLNMLEIKLLETYWKRQWHNNGNYLFGLVRDN